MQKSPATMDQFGPCSLRLRDGDSAFIVTTGNCCVGARPFGRLNVRYGVGRLAAVGMFIGEADFISGRHATI